MKICPQCQSTYTDESLKFCLQDGVLLETQAATGDWSESETIVTPAQRDKMRIDLPPPTPQRSLPPPETFHTEPRKQSNLPVVLATAFGTLLLLGLAAAAWFYFRNPQADVAQNTNTKTINVQIPNVSNANQTANVNFPILTNASPSPTATSAPKPTLNPDEAAKIRDDVSGVIDKWKSASEDLNLEEHLGNYANTVDYYKAGRINLSQVRADKQRAYELYNAINFDITNVKITPNETGERATAVFDKEWNFEGADKNSSGKVQQELQLAKMGGEWRITGEKDLKIYYLNK